MNGHYTEQNVAYAAISQCTCLASVSRESSSMRLTCSSAFDKRDSTRNACALVSRRDHHGVTVPFMHSTPRKDDDNSPGPR